MLLPRNAHEAGYGLASAVYLILFVASAVVSWVLRDDDGAGDVLGSDAVCEDSAKLGASSTCFRKEAVLRVSAGSLICLSAQLLTVVCARVVSCCQSVSDSVTAVSIAHGGAMLQMFAKDAKQTPACTTRVWHAALPRAICNTSVVPLAQPLAVNC